jgi:hypothetical protein
LDLGTRSRPSQPDRQPAADEPAIALSWYEYKLILSRLPARLEACGGLVRRIGDDAFLIWDCQK